MYCWIMKITVIWWIECNIDEKSSFSMHPSWCTAYFRWFESKLSNYGEFLHWIFRFELNQLCQCAAYKIYTVHIFNTSYWRLFLIKLLPFYILSRFHAKIFSNRRYFQKSIHLNSICMPLLCVYLCMSAYQIAVVILIEWVPFAVWVVSFLYWSTCIIQVSIGIYCIYAIIVSLLMY